MTAYQDPAYQFDQSEDEGPDLPTESQAAAGPA